MAVVNLREAAARLKAAMPEGYSVVQVEVRSYPRSNEPPEVCIVWRCYQQEPELAWGKEMPTFEQALADLVAKLPPKDDSGVQADESVEVDEPAKENTDGGG